MMTVTNVGFISVHMLSARSQY